MKIKALQQILEYLQQDPKLEQDPQFGQFTGGYYEHTLPIHSGVINFCYQDSSLQEVRFQSYEEIDRYKQMYEKAINDYCKRSKGNIPKQTSRQLLSRRRSLKQLKITEEQ